MKLTKLKYNPDNPRRISPEQLDRLIKSIESLPKMMELRPIVYDPDTMHILGGNQRLAALRKMGKTEIPDNWVKSADEMTDKEKREFILRDNVQSGEWDFGVLEENFADFDLDDIGIELPDGFGIDEPEITEDDYEQPEQIETDIKLGDLFSLRKDGKEIHRLLCGDATKKEDVERLMGGAKADIIITDPPYNLNFSYDEYKDDKSQSEYANMLSLAICKNKTQKAILTCGKQNIGLWYTLADIEDIAIWYSKNKMSGGKISNLSLWEPIIFIGKYDRNSRANDVYEYTNENQKDTGNHTCPKTIKFFSDIISSYTARNELIYEPFVGSGTTLVASHQLERKCYCVDISPQYCQVTLDRMRKLDPDIEVVKIDG